MVQQSQQASVAHIGRLAGMLNGKIVDRELRGI